MQINRYVNGEKIGRMAPLTVKNTTVRHAIETVNRRILKGVEEKA